jgi:protein-S-isoprenylcysteine O-methyltransferase Ste14
MLHLALALVVFYTLHSLLALNATKRWAAERWGLTRWYRLAYTLVSTVLSGWVLFALYNARTGDALYHPTAAMRVAGLLLVLGGGLLATVAALRFGGAGFLGLAPERAAGLVRTGMHGRMRHPIYTGIISAAIGWLLLDGHGTTLLVVGITFVYLPIGIALEERKLIAAFGEDYVRYRREVPALFPRLGKV